MDWIRIDPQPRNGKPFRIAFTNRGDEYWYNERLGWNTLRTNKMLFSWKCPFGADGEPVLVDGVWYWRKTK